MFNLILKEDNGIQIMAGKTGSGKSTLCKILAREYNYFYYDYESGLISTNISETGKWWEDKIISCRYNGIIFDVPSGVINKIVTDWDSYKWGIPIVITEQLNRNAIIGEK